MTAVRLLLPQGDLRRWHRALAERLAADGHRVLVALRPRLGAAPALTQLIETLEEWTQRGRTPAAMLSEPPGAWCAAESGEAELLFDLTGSISAERAQSRRLTTACSETRRATQRCSTVADRGSSSSRSAQMASMSTATALPALPEPRPTDRRPR